MKSNLAVEQFLDAPLPQYSIDSKTDMIFLDSTLIENL